MSARTAVRRAAGMRIEIRRVVNNGKLKKQTEKMTLSAVSLVKNAAAL